MRLINFIYTLLLFLCADVILAQGGVGEPGNYKDPLNKKNVETAKSKASANAAAASKGPAEVYKKFYHKPYNLDTIAKPVGIIARRVWRIVDFSNAENKNIFGKSAKGKIVIPLFEVMLYGLYTDKIKAFKKDAFYDKKTSLAYAYNANELNKLIFHTDTIEEREYDSNGEEKVTQKIKEEPINSSQLKGFVISEDWYMDKHFAKMDKRIVAICPVWYNTKTQKDEPLFWLYYPECRELFSSFEGNSLLSNDGKVTWDELLLNKWFNGIITKTSNVFDRNLNQYKKGDDVLIESYNGKESLMNAESDFFH